MPNSNRSPMGKRIVLDVDTQGLQDVTDPLSIFPEVISNSFDAEGVTTVMFHTDVVPHRSAVRVIIEDDSPEGWVDLKHAFTLFAKSSRRDKAEKRGRYNLGEKAFLSYANEALLETMQGAVEFIAGVRPKVLRRKRDKGTRLWAEVEMDRATYAAAMDKVNRIIPPEGVTFHVIDQVISRPRAAATIEVTLPTVIWNDEGRQVHSRRKTTVTLFHTEGAQAWIYEMGIPVVETDGPFHIDVGQKVPLNRDRDNVSPAFLTALRVAVLDATIADLSEEELAQPWVSDGVRKASDETLTTKLDRQYGKDRVAFTPGETEANTRAMAAGFTVVPSNAVTGEERQRAKDLGLLPSSASQFDTGKVNTGAGGIPPIPVERWTENMENIARYAMGLAHHLGVVLDAVQWYPKEANIHGAWSGNILSLNITVVAESLTALDALLIHEFGHSRVGGDNHFSDEYFHALCDFGARMRGWTETV